MLGTSSNWSILSIIDYDKEVRRCRTGSATWEPSEHIAKWKLRPYVAPDKDTPSSSSKATSRLPTQRQGNVTSMKHLPCRFWERENNVKDLAAIMAINVMSAEQKWQPNTGRIVIKGKE